MPVTNNNIKRQGKMRKLSIVVLVLLTVSGCASLTGQRTQSITFKTSIDNTEVAGVDCTLTNDAGSWLVTTPLSITVHKSMGDMLIDCKKNDLSGHETLVSKSNRAFWGNVSVIGYIVDRTTGAGFNYPDSVTINLDKVEVAANLPENAIIPGRPRQRTQKLHPARHQRPKDKIPIPQS